MKIAHNIPAMNARRNLNKNNKSLSANLEKLSSGYKINRAGDDAAGLAISEKMRAQITGLDAAQKNVDDGISLVKSAEGAMQEIQDMMNRMEYLATQSANGTYDNEVDRANLDKEVQALTDEISRIRDSSNFNGIPLLFGEEQSVIDGTGAQYVGGLPDWVVQPQAADGYMSGTYTVPATGKDHVAARVDFSALNDWNSDDLLYGNVGFHFTCCSCNRHYSIQFVEGTGFSKETLDNGTSNNQLDDHYIYKIGVDGVTEGEELVRRILSATTSPNGIPGRPGADGDQDGHYTYLIANPDKPSELILYDYRDAETRTAHPNLGWGLYGEGIAYHQAEPVTLGTKMILQIGESSNTYDRLKFILPNMSLDKLFLTDVSVATQAQAAEAVENIKKGINYVSSERGRMGAIQNRLEHTGSNLAVMEENIQDAESTIRDTDIADEMMAYTKNNILIQSAQAMLAQANQVPQGVLQLMQ